MTTAEIIGGAGAPGLPHGAGETCGKRHMVRLIGRVKFFDEQRGLGFLYFGDGSEDAMVKAECLGEHGLDRLLPETTVASQVECRTDGRRRVHRIWAIDESTVPPRSRGVASPRSDVTPTRADPVDAGSIRTERMSVRMYDTDKGWGFLTGKTGVEDVFVHVSVVHAAGLPYIEQGREYEVDFGPSRKGPYAMAIRPAEGPA